MSSSKFYIVANKDIYIFTYDRFYIRWLLPTMDSWNERNKSMNKYNKVPNHIKILDKILSFKGQLRSFLLQHAFYLAEEHIS